MSKMAAILAVLLCIAVAVSGCGRPQQTYTTPDGKVTTTKTGPNSGKVEFQGKEGKVTVETNQGQTVTEADLGVPVYPGVTVLSTNKMDMNGGKMEQYSLSTTDSVDKVAEFYKSNLKNVVNSSSGSSDDGQTATFTVGSNEKPTNIIIHRGKSDDKTLIAITKSM